jgi:hypothetical protein
LAFDSAGRCLGLEIFAFIADTSSIAKGKSMSTYEQELYRRTDEVLHYVWDPAGVSNSPVARDDYDGYLPAVFAMLNNGESESAIAAYLDSLEERDFRLEPDTEMTLHVAAILAEWRDILTARHGGKP